MNEVHSGDYKSVGFCRRVHSRGRLLWDGLCRNVRSSLTVSVSFESSVALVCMYAGLGYLVATSLESTPGL